MVSKKERKVLCATLHVDSQNTGAYKLYAGLGFSIDGVLQDYYSPGETSSLTIMPRTLLLKCHERSYPPCRKAGMENAAEFGWQCI